MAYLTSNPPFKMTDAIAAGGTGLYGMNVWGYKSADAKATVVAAGYITNAVQLGMQIGDIVLVSDTATPQCSIMAVNSFTVNAANLGYVQNS